MQLSWDAVQANAVTFSKKWKDAHNEEAQAQGFLLDFLRVFGVDEPMRVGAFEYKVPLSENKTGYIDYLWKGRIAVEMKSRGKDLNLAHNQLQNYMQHLPDDEMSDLWLICDFENMRLNRRSTKEIWNFKSRDLHRHIKKFADIAGYTGERVRSNQAEVNVKAAEKMADLHDALKDNGYDGHHLEVYLVRLLFCMFANDTGIFPQDNFSRYLEKSNPNGSDLSNRITRLFEILDMPEAVRNKRTLLSDELKQFRYINGGLFNIRLPSADFDSKMRKTLLECVNFDWSNISPAIFGAMFQSIMDKNRRRELGAHYTSEENILKLINPLFLDDLWKEFNKVKTNPIALDLFHSKLAGLKFLDPACGCGNFLIITYRELRILELEILKMKSDNFQLSIDITELLRVSVEQFYGIECEDFPCQIAQVGMWLIDHQMNIRASEQFGMYYARLPLTQSATVVQGNALQIDWKDVVPVHELSYILGNPPFIGSAYTSAEQKLDMRAIFPKNKNLDYVCAWYKKAADMMKTTAIKTAFVSTSSITQGEQPTLLWKPLFEQGIHINFGISAFKWSNEAKGKAAVYCVIIGFSYIKTKRVINQYLIEAPQVFIERRNTPLCDAPKMSRGSDPVDGGNLIIEDDDYENYIAKEPAAAKYIRPFMMGHEFLNNKKRYCLWLVDASPTNLRKLPLTMKRVEQCRQLRIGRSKEKTSPALFESARQPETDYLAIPKVSSEKRHYIPIGFLDKNVIAGDKLFTISGSSLYHFGILTSSVHMAWMRALAGRLKSDYSYSNTIVYNNFPWPDVTSVQKVGIEELAQAVLDTRARFPDSSLADMYDPAAMPPVLLKAHQALDRAVMKLYGFSAKYTEADCVAALMERYRVLVG